MKPNVSSLMLSTPDDFTAEYQGRYQTPKKKKTMTELHSKPQKVPVR